MHRLWRATVNSWKGLRAAATSDAAIREELAVLALSVPVAWLISTNLWTRIALIASVLFVLVVELLNTSIEKLADHVTPDLNPSIGRIKDIGSAAVGGALVLAAIVWLAALAEFAGLL